MNNKAAIGYMILACKDLNIDPAIIKKIEENMVYFMDIKTTCAAEREVME